MSDEGTESWVFVGGLPFELTEGDVICVFSQYGEVAEINLVRDRETGKSRGFGFVKYEDPRSCELAVDNFCGATIVGRKITVDYSKNAQAIKKKRPLPAIPQEPVEASTKERLLPIQDIRFDRGDEKIEPKEDRPRNELVRYRRRSPSQDSYHERDHRLHSRSDHKHSRLVYHEGRDRPLERRSHREHRSRSRSRSPRRHKKSSRHRSSSRDRRRKKEKKSRHRRSSSSSERRSHHRKHSRHH